MTMLLSLFIVIPARAQDITTGLIGHWKMDETSGAAITDSGSGGHDGTWTDGGDNDVSGETAAGRVGNALRFGSNTAVNTTGYVIGTTGTISMWFRPAMDMDASTSDTRLLTPSGDGGRGTFFTVNWAKGSAGATECSGDDGSLDFVISPFSGAYSVACTATTSWNAGSWYHVVATWDGSTQKMYVNGVLETSIAQTQSPDFGSVLVGNGTGLGFIGDIDDVRLYNRVLTDEDIKALYGDWPGHLRYNTSYRAAEYYDGNNWIAMGPVKYTPTAMNFNSASLYDGGGGMAGATDGRKGTLSFWFKANDANGEYIYSHTSGTVIIQFTAGGELQISMFNQTLGTMTLRMYTTSLGGDTTSWHHVMADWDVDAATPAHLYLDGEEDLNLDIVNVQDIQYNTSVRIGAKHNETSPYDGALADFWFDFNDDIDLSDPKNRIKFYNNGPVYLGANGELPTGSPPTIFLSGDAADWHTNKGTGGGFTKSGALTQASTAPGGILPPSDGLIAHWRLDETSGNIARDSAASNTGILQNFTLPGAWQGSGGVYKGALDFNAAADGNDVMYVSNSASLDDLDAFTISFWLDIDSKGSGTLGYLFLKDDDLEIFVNNWNVFFEPHRWSIKRGQWFRGRPADGSGWHHFAFTYSYSDLSNDPIFYIDGVAKTITEGVTPDGVPATSTADLLIGNTTNLNGGIDGRMDDIRIYNRVLSPEEISQLYNATLMGCTNPEHSTGSVIYNTTSNVLQYCDGANWVAAGPVPGAGGGGCSGPAGSTGAVVYNTDHNLLQYCDGADWIAIGKEPPPCGGIGGVCADGTVYAGISPDGNAFMFTTAADGPATNWNDGTTNSWEDTAMANCTDDTPGTAASCQTGEANTAFLHSLAGSGTPAPYSAAEYCAALTANGHDDWYLPAQDELNVLYTNKTAIGGFTTTGQWYWSSSEVGDGTAKIQQFSGGLQGNDYVWSSRLLRCVRR